MLLLGLAGGVGIVNFFFDGFKNVATKTFELLSIGQGF